MTATIIPLPGLHDEPAFIERAADGLVIHAIYCFNGERHRIGGPAVIKHDRETRVCTLEEWWLRGRFQRAIERDRVTGAETVIWPARDHKPASL